MTDRLIVSKADEGTMLKKEGTTTLTQFRMTRFITKWLEELEGQSTSISQKIEEAHEFTIKTARHWHNQRQKGFVLIMQVVLTVAVAHNLLHCHVVEDPIRVMMSKATVLDDVSRAAMKIINHASVNDEVGCPCNVQILDLEVTMLLAATIGHCDMSAASGAIARDLCDCFNSRQEMLVPVVPVARVFGASVQMISVKQLALAWAQ
jgi:hypothetical protein